MKIEIGDWHNIYSQEPDNKLYICQVAYIPQDSHKDKKSWGNDGTVFKIRVHAPTIETALAQAMRIVNIERAIDMCMIPDEHPDYIGKESLTHDDIKAIVDDTRERGVYQAWMLIEPTSIQIHLEDDEETLMGMTANNIEQIIERTSDEAEEYLKEITDDE